MVIEDVSAIQSREGDPYLSVVSPVYGCASCIPGLVDQVVQSVEGITDSFEIILVDDGSPDDAWSHIRRLCEEDERVVGFRLSRNFGQHAAIRAGIEQARGEWTVVMDCDLQDRPAAIPDLHAAAVSQGVDVVFARRVDRQDAAGKRLGSWAFYRILSWLTGDRYDESIANFGIYHRRVVESVRRMPEAEWTFPLLVRWVGFTATSVPVPHDRRQNGKSGYNFGSLVRLATSIALSYSEKPLRLVASGGVVCSLLAFVLTAVTLSLFFTGRTTVAGFTSLMASMWLLGGLVLFSLGVVGLYVGRVFRNAQRRPSAIVMQRVPQVSEARTSSAASITRSR